MALDKTLCVGLIRWATSRPERAQGAFLLYPTLTGGAIISRPFGPHENIETFQLIPRILDTLVRPAYHTESIVEMILTAKSRFVGISSCLNPRFDKMTMRVSKTKEPFEQ